MRTTCTHWHTDIQSTCRLLSLELCLWSGSWRQRTGRNQVLTCSITIPPVKTEYFNRESVHYTYLAILSETSSPQVHIVGIQLQTEAHLLLLYEPSSTPSIIWNQLKRDHHWRGHNSVSKTIQNWHRHDQKTVLLISLWLVSLWLAGLWLVRLWLANLRFLRIWLVCGWLDCLWLLCFFSRQLLVNLRSVRPWFASLFLLSLSLVGL